jgi:hypothetical protein
VKTNIPYAVLPHISGSALIQKVAHFLQLAPSRTCIIQQVAQFARIRLDICIVLLELRIALQHQDLMLRTAGLPCGVHRRRGFGCDR